MDCEVNRLAKGLAREETRQIYKRDMPTRMNDLAGFLTHKFKLPYMQIKGVRPVIAMKSHAELDAYVKANYELFNNYRQAIRIPKKTHISAIDSGLYWAPIEMGFERKDGEALPEKFGKTDLKGFEERVLALTYMRYAASPQSVRVDEIYQRVTVNDHTLYRMIDRGATEKEPLALLNYLSILWLPWINAFALHQVSGGIIPTNDGCLCLQSFRNLWDDNDPNYELHDRRRYTITKGGLYLTHLKTPDLTMRTTDKGQRYWTEYRISTYLSKQEMRSERLWAWDAMSEFQSKYSNEMLELFHLNQDLDLYQDIMKNIQNEFTDFYRDMKKLFTNPRFVAACKTVSLS